MKRFEEYLEHGWTLTPLRPGTKEPRLKDWQLRENAIRGVENAYRLNESAGLLLGHCDPPLMTLDIDDFQSAAGWCDERGIDLCALLQAEDAVQIVSGKPNSSKLLYRIDQPRRTRKVAKNGRTILEFRCASDNGGSVQDVLPPSIHPDTGESYRWGGFGQWRYPPEIPAKLIRIWGTPGERRDETAPPGQAGITNLPGPFARLETVKVEEALQHISPDCEREEWIKVMLALKSTGHPNAFEWFNEWSAGCPERYPGRAECLYQWESATVEGGITIGTLYHLAKGGNIAAGQIKADIPAAELVIQELNQSYAWITDQGERPVMTIHNNTDVYEDMVSFSTVGKFRQTLSNRPQIVVGRKPNGEPKLIDQAAFWIGHPDRREYRQVTFNPAHPSQDLNGCFNLFTGWALKPEAGDVSTFLDFVNEVICNGDEELADWLIGW